MEEFKTKLPQLDFDKIIPYPIIERPDNTTYRLQYSGGTKLDDKEDGYHWCISNWGTKWNCSGDGDSVPFEQVGKKLFCDFNTAWSPPIPIINKLGQLYPDLVFDLKFWEGGNAFKGRYKIQNQVCLIDEQKSYRGHRGG